MELTAGQIAELLSGELRGDPSLPISGLGPAGQAGPDQIAFAVGQVQLEEALAGNAGAILLPPGLSLPGDCRPALILVDNPRLAAARLLERFHPEPRPPAGIHPGASVDPRARVHPQASVGDGCHVGADASIGAGTILDPGVHVGEGCRIGDGCRLFPRVVLYPGCRLGHRVRIHAGSVIGSDGYGYVLDGERHRKIPQVGGVRIGDDVELGANVAVDRGALGDTVIGEGTRVDNLVQIAHNVSIGRHCLIVAQAGIAGSTAIGDHTVIAGQAGIAGHLSIGKGVSIAAQSGIMQDIPDGGKIFGTPGQPDREAKRQILALRRLPGLLRRFARLEERLGSGGGAGSPDG